MSLRLWLSIDEGVEPMPYQDDDGVWTVGIGHNLEANGLPFSIVQMIEPAATASKCPFPACLAFLQAQGGLEDVEIESLYQLDIQDVRSWLEPIFETEGEIPEWPTWAPPRWAAIQNMAFNLGPTRFSEFTTFIPLCQAKNWTAAANDLRGSLVFRQLTTRYTRIADTIESGLWPSILSSAA